MASRAALLLIDLQPDFLPGGPLAVPAGDAVIPPCNALRSGFHWPGGVYLTQDWHPADHISFAASHPGAVPFSTVHLPAPTGEQTLWPTHCVQGTPGAMIHAGVARGGGDVVVQKGAVRLVDSYSGFGDAAGGAVEKSPLEGLLRSAGATAVAVAGLALDWCVAYTCRDARRLGFDTYLVLDCCRGIDPGKVACELAQLRGAGVHVVDTAAQLPEALFARA